ncbi:hypothetical protein ACQ4LE_000685 [Meloidogyne hapla]
MTKVLMSGVQPTGIMHIGNYLGFLRHFVKLQESEDYNRRILKIADLHSISMGFTSSRKLREDICQTLAILLSTGVDPLKTIIVQQSRVPELTELMWILGSASTLPKLTGLSQFKDKSNKLKAVPIGLVTYPLLQAADVLGYHSTHVLVGSDQKQHLELLREIAHSFNYKTGTEYFSIPEQVHTSCPKIKSLCDPMVKMSKSDPKTKSFISLVDSTEIIVEKIKSALSDFKPEITFDPEKRPAISNLVSFLHFRESIFFQIFQFVFKVMLYGEFSGMSTDQVIEDCRGLDTLAFKLHLASVIDKHLKPIRETYHQLMRDESILWEVLENGGKRARQIVTKTLEDIKTIVGFR